jgi:hypothetical protein
MDDNQKVWRAPFGLEQQYRELFTTMVPEFEKHLLPAFATQQEHVAVRTVTTYGAYEAPIIG